MKIRSIWIAAIAVLLTLCMGAANAETVHQTVAGDKLTSGDGKNAVDKGEMEVKKVEGAQSESGQVARAKGENGQWSFVTAWFGVPAPEGKSVVRFRIYVDGQKTAKCLLYTRTKDGLDMVGPLNLPADAKANSFVTVDVPVTVKSEWSGLTIKKAEKSDVPGPWIDTVSIVLPG